MSGAARPFWSTTWSAIVIGLPGQLLIHSCPAVGALGESAKGGAPEGTAKSPSAGAASRRPTSARSELRAHIRTEVGSEKNDRDYEVVPKK